MYNALFMPIKFTHKDVKMKHKKPAICCEKEMQNLHYYNIISIFEEWAHTRTATSAKPSPKERSLTAECILILNPSPREKDFNTRTAEAQTPLKGTLIAIAIILSLSDFKTSPN